MLLYETVKEKFVLKVFVSFVNSMLLRCHAVVFSCVNWYNFTVVDFVEKRVMWGGINNKVVINNEFEENFDATKQNKNIFSTCLHLTGNTGRPCVGGTRKMDGCCSYAYAGSHGLVALRRRRGDRGAEPACHADWRNLTLLCLFLRELATDTGTTHSFSLQFFFFFRVRSVFSCGWTRVLRAEELVVVDWAETCYGFEVEPNPDVI